MPSSPGSPRVLVVEDGGGAARPESARHALSSATITLALAILGSSVLPVPYAFSRLGLLPGLGCMLLVALGNALAGTLLLRCAYSLDQHTYEGLAEVVGGPSWKLATEVCLILLLWGNVTGDLCLLADMGTIAASQLFPGGAPAWLVAGNGRIIMAALTALVVFPLSCLRHMRELERVGMLGVCFVVALAGVFSYYSLSEGLPALASGELPLLRPAVAASVPEAVGVLSFAFYLTPMLLPLLREMPAGKLGVDLTCRAAQGVTVGVAYAAYAVIGVFAAARYGLRTQGDVLVNSWLPGRWDGVLDALMTLYLSISAAPMAMTLRCQLENLILEEGQAMPRGRQVALTAVSLLSSLALALAFPTQAEKIFSVTGATAVCAVVYVMPVAIHLRLYLRHSGWWCCGRRGSSRGKGSGERRQLARRRSFSFDRRLPTAAPRTAAGPGRPGTGTAPAIYASSGGSPDTRGLLSADHHANAASLPRLLNVQSRQLASAFAAAQQQLQGSPDWAGTEEEEDDRPLPRDAVALLSAHRWTDLSLNRWLQGQSADSLPAYLDSLPPTPLSGGGLGTAQLQQYSRDGRGSLDSLISDRGPGSTTAERLAAAGQDQQQQQQPQQQQVAAAWQGEGQSLQKSPEPGGPRPPLPAAALAMPVLPVVPETTSLLGGSSSSWSWGGGYPSLADAGSGLQAVAPLLRHLVLPLLVLLLGVACSISALCLAVAALVKA